MVMLIPVDDGPAVVACNTCRQAPPPRGDAAAVPDGAKMVEALRIVQAGDSRYAGIAVQEMPCLFACSQACTIHLRAPGKIGYILGGFIPDAAAARAILDYAVEHAASAHGQVPYAQWPEGVKGHFLTRMPPAGYVAE